MWWGRPPWICWELSVLLEPGYLFPPLGEGSFQALFLQISLIPLSHFFWWNCIMSMCLHFMFKRSLNLFYCLKILFSFCCLDWVLSIALSTRLLLYFDAPANLLLILSSVHCCHEHWGTYGPLVYFFSVIVFFNLCLVLF